MQFGRSYEEFEVGATYKHWPGKTVTEYDDHLFCLLTMNHHPLHLDAHYAGESTQFGKNVVVGNYVYSILLGMSVPDVSGKAIANLEIESLRHVAPTFHGDTLYGETTVLDKWESKSKDDRGVVHVETIGYNQDGTVVCIFRRKVMVPKNSYLEARGGEQPGRPVPQPDRFWPGASLGLTRRERPRQRQDHQDQHHGHGEAETQRARSHEPGHHGTEQRARVVELVEPGDHRIHSGLAVAVVRAGTGDPGGGGEAQRRDHRDGRTEDREAGHRHRPGRRPDDHREGRGCDQTAHPQQCDRAEPCDQPVPGQSRQSARQQVREGRQRDERRRCGEGVVEVVRSPGRGRGVDHVEEHHRGADQQERSPRHVDGRHRHRRPGPRKERRERHAQVGTPTTRPATASGR